MLDVGCGWGAFAVHAAKAHGAHVTGITLSEPQAARARQRAAEEGVADRVDIRVADYRDLRRRDVRRDRLDRHGRARRRGEHRRVRAHARRPAGARRAAAQPRHRAAAPRRAGGRPVLRALRLPRRGAAAPLARPARARGRGLRDAPRRGPPRGLRADPARVDAPAGGEPRRGACGSPAPSACASGRSTCARPGAASRPASRRSTRSAPSARSAWRAAAAGAASAGARADRWSQEADDAHAPTTPAG